MRSSLVEYDDRRLPEYDELYERAERQTDLASLRVLVRERLVGARVLELACGTGYWTDVAAEVAEEVVATDLSRRALDAARSRVRRANVRFKWADAYTALRSLHGFTAVLAAFWWSHVPRSRLPEFAADLAASLGAGGRAVLLDNRYVEGNSTPIHRTDVEGNTYQHRCLQDGTAFEIVKNFPSREQLVADLTRVTDAIDVRELTHYWFVACSLRT